MRGENPTSRGGSDHAHASVERYRAKQTVTEEYMTVTAPSGGSDPIAGQQQTDYGLRKQPWIEHRTAGRGGRQPRRVGATHTVVVEQRRP